MEHDEYCIGSAEQSAWQNMGDDASPAELRAEALSYLESGLSDCTCWHRAKA